MSALQAVVRPDGLEAIVGADDAAWLAAEARKAKERVERYDGVDGAAALFDEEDASDGGACEAFARAEHAFRVAAHRDRLTCSSMKSKNGAARGGHGMLALRRRDRRRGLRHLRMKMWPTGAQALGRPQTEMARSRNNINNTTNNNN